MAISTVTNRVEYQGNGTSAVFAFPYRFHAQSDLAVFVYNSSLAAASIVAPKVLNTDYTVSATANSAGVYPSGGNIVFNSTPNAQSVIIVFRSSVVTNAFTVGQNGAIPSSGLNNELDNLTMIAQRLQDQVTRSVRMPDGFYGTFDPTLPPDLGRIGSSTLMIAGNGRSIVMGPTADQIFGAASSAVAAAASAAAAAVSEGNAATSEAQANSAAVSCGISVVLVNSAVTSIGNAVSLIGSTAFWGATAQSSALSASNNAVLAASAAVSAGLQAAIASSSALSASNNAVAAGSAALSASNSAASAATFNPMTASGDMIVGSNAGQGARLPGPTSNSSAVLVSRSVGGTAMPPVWALSNGPTVQTFTAGSSTYTVPSGVRWLRIRAIGGGAGGGGGSNQTGDGTAGGAGQLTHVGSGSGQFVMFAGGAATPANAHTGGVGGTSAVTGAMTSFTYRGSNGQGAINAAASVAYSCGGHGGASPFGSSGSGNDGTNTGTAAGANSGSGGGGGGGQAGGGGSGGGGYGGGGGGAGGYIEAIYRGPLNSSYVVSVGAGGGAGGAGTNGGGGGAGAGGVVIIEEYYF